MLIHAIIDAMPQTPDLRVADISSRCVIAAMMICCYDMLRKSAQHSPCATDVADAEIPMP